MFEHRRSKRSLLASAAALLCCHRVPVMAAATGHGATSLASLGETVATSPTQRLEIVSLSDWAGLDLKGNHDNGSLMSSAASQVPDAGGVLDVPAGTIVLGSCTYLKANTWLRGKGVNTLLCATGDTTAADPLRSPGLSPCLFSNVGAGGPKQIHGNITVSDLLFTRCDNAYYDGHALQFRAATNLRVQRVHGIGCADLVAAIFCDDVTVEDCHGINSANCDFDFWESCTNVRVIKSTSKKIPALLGRNTFPESLGSAVNFNSVDTGHSNAALQSQCLLVERCTFSAESPSGAMIFVAPLAPATPLIGGVTIRRNQFSGGAAPLFPIIAMRACSGARVVENQFFAFNGSKLILISVAEDGDGELGTQSRNVVISKNIAYGCHVGTFIEAIGEGHCVERNALIQSSAEIGVNANSPETRVLANNLAGSEHPLVNRNPWNGRSTPAAQFRP